MDGSNEYMIDDNFDMNDMNDNTDDIDNIDLTGLGNHLENQDNNVEYYLQHQID